MPEIVLSWFWCLGPTLFSDMILGMQESRVMLQEIETQKQQLWKRSIASAFDSRIRRSFPAVALHL